MFEVIFTTILRSVGIPIVSILILQSVLGLPAAFGAVTIALIVASVFSIIWQLIKIIPNMLLLKPANIIKLCLRIGIEIISCIGFVLYYFSNISGK